MFIELVDALRCPVAHEESWLVAAAMTMEARHIVEGTLGCPVCKTQYAISRGVVDFRRAHSQPAAPRQPTDAETAMRLAALLGLSESHGFAVLVGDWGNQAAALSAIVDVPLVLVDPPEDVIGAPGISVIRCDGLIPLAEGAARATAIDATTPERVASAIRATRTTGRIIAPIGIERPADVSELARDENVWVGERIASASPLVTLHVRRG